ncbi:hypothetical protein [Acidovorax sp.]|uniref:hypothetical protein n=1 Tax=Acidovorax sp. TaxID=1872122 RepID=UPI003CFCADCF
MTVEDLFDRVEPLDPDRRDALHAACQSMGLSDGAVQGVEHAARLLREFELYGKARIQTPAQRLKKLRLVADLSRRLSSALSEVRTLDKVCIHARLEEVGLPDGLPFPQSVPIPGLAQYFEVALRSLEEAVLALCDQAPAPSKGGRKTLMTSYLMFIEWLWESVKDEERVTLGRDGKFERIADAAFTAAGVPAAAAGAVRFFVEVRQSADSTGHELD